jgi:hypothetical protein
MDRAAPHERHADDQQRQRHERDRVGQMRGGIGHRLDARPLESREAAQHAGVEPRTRAGLEGEQPDGDRRQN